MNLIKREEKVEEFLEKKLGASWNNYPKCCEFQLKVYKWYLEQKKRVKHD